MSRINLASPKRATPPRLAVFASLALLSACGLVPATEPLADGNAWHDTCPDHKQVAAQIAVDASGTYNTGEVSGPFETAIRDRATRVAMCGGHLRVDAFSGSNAGTQALFDGSLTVKGATANAKARRAPAAVDAVVAAVKKQFPLDTSALAPGSDIVGQLWNGQQFASQLGDGYVLDLVIQTDGLDNRTLRTRRITDKASAKRAAESVEVPQLTGAWVTITGLGEVAGKPVDSSVTDALAAFYTALCKRTGAERCTVAIDYVSPVGG